MILSIPLFTPLIVYAAPSSEIYFEDVTRELLHNDFGNSLPSQIGGTLTPIKEMNLGSLTSLTLLALIASVTTGIIIAKRRRFFA
jgi:hypothetical protein